MVGTCDAYVLTHGDGVFENSGTPDAGMSSQEDSMTTNSVRWSVAKRTATYKSTTSRVVGWS